MPHSPWLMRHPLDQRSTFTRLKLDLVTATRHTDLRRRTSRPLVKRRPAATASMKQWPQRQYLPFRAKCSSLFEWCVYSTSIKSDRRRCGVSFCMHFLVRFWLWRRFLIDFVRRHPRDADATLATTSSSHKCTNSYERYWYLQGVRTVSTSLSATSRGPDISYCL